MNFAAFDDPDGASRYYEAPIRLIQADTPADIPPALADMQAALEAGHHLAGWFAYELGGVLEPCLTHIVGEGPLLQFGVFESYATELPDAFTAGGTIDLEPSPIWDQADYTARFDRVQDLIRAGDVYQINLTFPLHAKTGQAAPALYAALRARASGRYGGVISLGGPEIISLSPELFFRRDGELITLRPMKGTAPHGTDLDDAKTRAENLMIVDLLRNDLSRIAVPGSVAVPELFTVESYPTLTQLTSTVTGRAPGAGVSDILRALFPCGSVTGAPKIRAMEVIHELEAGPRGPYCGAMGFFDPDGSAVFNVMIRTLIKRGEDLTYHTGSGVVADSVAADEYAECLLKTRILKTAPALIETFRWADGFVRLDRHMARLETSARALGYPVDISAIRTRLHIAAQSWSGVRRVRLALAADGGVDMSVMDLVELSDPVRLWISPHDFAQDTAHKTTERQGYARHLDLAKAAGADEALIFNARGELCEGSFTSVFVKLDGKLVTPPLDCGLLPGVLRAQLVETGAVADAVLTHADLDAADAVYVGNSLRGLMRAEII